MGRLITADYAQMFLLPPRLEDLVPEDHPARFIRDFVDSLDLRQVGIRIPQTSGGDSYDPRLLLSVWLYGYFVRIYSSRRLEQACYDNVGVLWLAGMNHPDHNTLWRFWNANKKVIKVLFKRSVTIAHDCGLVGMVLHALDGTKVAAECSRRSGWHRSSLEEALKRADQVIEEIMARVEAQGDEGESLRLPEEFVDAQQRKARIEERLKALKEAGVDHLNPGEEDARMMKGGTGRQTFFAYNAQTMVDEQSGLIVAEEVVTAESDNHELVPMLDETKEMLGGVAANTVADGGYVSGESIAAAQEKEYVATLNLAEETDEELGKNGVYPSTRFEYDAEKDVCICPQGKEVRFEREKQKTGKHYMVRIYRCKDRTCPFREQCSRDKKGRGIEIAPYHAAMQKQREEQRKPGRSEDLKKRGGIVERVYAGVKEHSGFRRFTVRGLPNVKAQWALVCLTANLKVLYQYWKMGNLALAESH